MTNIAAAVKNSLSLGKNICFIPLQPLIIYIWQDSFNHVFKFKASANLLDSAPQSGNKLTERLYPSIVTDVCNIIKAARLLGAR